MGNNQSIFYPDNPKRRDRADQLANDCQSFKSTFDAKHAEVEQILGPYKAKLDNVLRAFGCTDLDQLDHVVQERATGQALADWNKTKGNYDKTQMYVHHVHFGTKYTHSHLLVPSELIKSSWGQWGRK